MIIARIKISITGDTKEKTTPKPQWERVNTKGEKRNREKRSRTGEVRKDNKLPIRSIKVLYDSRGGTQLKKKKRPDGKKRHKEHRLGSKRALYLKGKREKEGMPEKIGSGENNGRQTNEQALEKTSTRIFTENKKTVREGN